MRRVVSLVQEVACIIGGVVSVVVGHRLRLVDWSLLFFSLLSKALCPASPGQGWPLTRTFLSDDLINFVQESCRVRIGASAPESLDTGRATNRPPFSFPSTVRRRRPARWKLLFISPKNPDSKSQKFSFETRFSSAGFLNVFPSSTSFPCVFLAFFSAFFLYSIVSRVLFKSLPSFQSFFSRSFGVFPLQFVVFFCFTKFSEMPKSTDDVYGIPKRDRNHNPPRSQA